LGPVEATDAATPTRHGHGKRAAAPALIPSASYQYSRGGFLVELISWGKRSIGLVNVVWPGCNLDDMYLGFLASTDNPGPLFAIGAGGRFGYHGTTEYQPDAHSNFHRVMEGLFNGKVLNSKTIALNVGMRRLDSEAPPGCVLALQGQHNGYAIQLHYSHHYSGWA
jgi:hypothetical protein